MIDYILYQIGQFLALHLPLRFSYAIAIFFSSLRANLFGSKDRKAVTGNLKAIFPEKSPGEIEKIRRCMFSNFAKYLVDFFRFPLLNKEVIKRTIDIKNIGYFDEALSKGKGVILITAHLGNWELGGVLLGLLGYPILAVALPHKHKKVDDFFNTQRKNKGMGVIPLGRALPQCIRRLNNNEIIALVIDRDFTDKGLLLEFLGRKTIIPLGAAVLGLKTDATIVPAFLLRNPDDTFTFVVEKPVETFQPTTDTGARKKLSNEYLMSAMARYITIVEEYIKKYPEQWFMFRQYWKD
ncbi:MAG: hypothetical protein C4540_07005 [Candidatus Omnitrophota bacterium]|jgi:KDO2-lipid IV(A) lauroyltransferase|nr:MAG: hypothetical protein C4540_07005 [Candidatus Omnitrophota bacterium]